MDRASLSDTPINFAAADAADAQAPLFPIDREPQFAPEFNNEGWRGWAAVFFAAAPALVFLAVVLLHVLTHP